MRDDGEEVGQHRLTDLVDPVRILDEVERRFGAGQRRGVDQRGQPAPPGIRIDFGQCSIGVGDAQQILQQHEILGVGIRNLSPQLSPGRRTIEFAYPGRRPQQPRDHMERDVAGMGLAKCPHHLNPATGRQRGGFPSHAALADTRQPHHRPPQRRDQ